LSAVLLITPPFTQLNTPYPATAYIKGFLNTKSITSFQCDLGIEVILKLFSKNGLRQIFERVNMTVIEDSNVKRIYNLREAYIDSIGTVIGFLQGNDTTIAHAIAKRSYLPEASRFGTLQQEDWAFGSMGVVDKAKYYATLYLEDLSDFIIATTDSFFGFSRYAERLARCANEFDELLEAIENLPTYIDEITFDILLEKIKSESPELVILTAPFPGNVYSAFKCGKYIKANFPNIKIAFGGGFANTELRHLSDARVFNYVDFISLDDGELPLEQIYNYIQSKATLQDLKRTFIVQNQTVMYCNTNITCDYKQNEVGTPDYSDLLLDKYISAIEVVNPMHSLWSNGRWNKLTMAHGCYWGKCTFCDTSLPYIKDYEPLTAALLCNRVEQIIKQTNSTGFHFVDEAAPPKLMAAFALEIIQRKIKISWWTNVRFEKSFTRDVCLLLKASGCIGVSGGLEVASERLLKLINKGITVQQVALVNKNFIEAGIMVHAYLMYGYPTQTIQETIDSLEVVRQMFSNGVLQSGFWHQFALTTHSPIGLHPTDYNIKITNSQLGSFANNDLDFVDATKINHDQFSFGLKKSLFNFMQGVGLDDNLQAWFDFKIPKSTIAPQLILNYLEEPTMPNYKPNGKIVFLGGISEVEKFTQTKKGRSREMLKVVLYNNQNDLEIQVPFNEGNSLLELITPIAHGKGFITYQQLLEHFTHHAIDDAELFWENKPINQLWKVGLIYF
jgi:hypothetical protein